MANNIIVNNKKAYHEYFIEDTFDCGIVLVGSEVKSVRDGGMSLNESFVQVKNNEVFLKNAYIKPFEKTTAFVPDSHRDRKLLLNKREILKLTRGVKEKNYTIVPTKVYLKNNLVKVEIALAKGKKLYDKREAIAKKTVERDIARQVRR